MDLFRLIRNVVFLIILASPIATAGVLVGEEDGTPSHLSTSCWAIKVANGNLTANSDGTCSVADQSVAGSGDITGVGDCASGECFNGTSGTTITFNGATSGTTTLAPTAIAGTTTITLPAETGTVCTTGSVCSGYQASGSYLIAGDIDTYAELNTIVADATLTHNGLIDTYSELNTIVADATLTHNGLIDTYAELNAIVADVTVTHNGLIDTFAELDTIVANKSLANMTVRSVGITIDGGGSAITTGVKGFIEIPYACTISRNTVLLAQSGSIVIDVWKDTYANYPPTVADTITASAKPTVTTATKSQDATLTGWTTSVTAGDILGFNVDSITTATRAHLILKCDM